MQNNCKTGWGPDTSAALRLAARVPTGMFQLRLIQYDDAVSLVP